MYKIILSVTLVNSIGTLASFLFLALISTFVAQAEIGLYGTLLSYLNVGVAICGLGFEKLLIRDFKTDEGFDYSLFRELVIGQVIFAFCAGVIATTVLNMVDVSPIIFALALTITISGRTFQRAIRLLGFPKTALVIDAAIIRCGLLLITILLWANNANIDGLQLFEILIFLSSFALIVYVLAFKKGKSNGAATAKINHYRSIMTNFVTAKFFWFNNIASVIAKEIDVVVAYNLLGGAEAASLFFGRRLYNVMSTINQGAGFSFEHKFSDKSRKDLSKLELFSHLRNTVSTLSIGAFIILTFGVYFVEYQFQWLEDVFYVSLIFMVIRLLENLIGPVFLYLNMRGYENFVFYAISVSLTLKLALFYLIPEISLIQMTLISGSLILFPAFLCLRKIRGANV